MSVNNMNNSEIIDEIVKLIVKIKDYHISLPQFKIHFGDNADYSTFKSLKDEFIKGSLEMEWPLEYKLNDLTEYYKWLTFEGYEDYNAASTEAEILFMC